MERIGIRELRQNASTWVARAHGGETIEIANHGRLVARLVPVSDTDTDRETLIDTGRLTPAHQRGEPFDDTNLIDLGPTAQQSLSDILQEQRRDR